MGDLKQKDRNYYGTHFSATKAVRYGYTLKSPSVFQAAVFVLKGSNMVFIR